MRYAVLLLVVACGCGTTKPSVPLGAPLAVPGKLSTCDVWNRELSFAASVAHHDAAKFREHLLPGAIFFDQDSLLRGPDAIVQGWASIIAGETFALTWRPTTVAFTGDSHVALTRGPYWVELPAVGGRKRYLAGMFQSVWVRDVDGVWRVAIDGGTPPAKAATEQEIERLQAWAPLTCPATPP